MLSAQCGNAMCLPFSMTSGVLVAVCLCHGSVTVQQRQEWLRKSKRQHKHFRAPRHLASDRFRPTQIFATNNAHAQNSTLTPGLVSQRLDLPSSRAERQSEQRSRHTMPTMVSLGPLGEVSTNELMLLAFFTLATLAFLYYMYKVVGGCRCSVATWHLAFHITCCCVLHGASLPLPLSVEYQNMDPEDFADDEPQESYQDFTKAGAWSGSLAFRSPGPVSHAPATWHLSRASELKEFNGADGKGILIGVMGIVFDCSSGADFYGPGGAYHAFAGQDATLGLASMEVDPANWPKRASRDDLTAQEEDTLNSWIQKFEEKYPVVGFLTDGFEGRSTEAVMEILRQQELEEESQEEGADATLVESGDVDGQDEGGLRHRAAGSGDAGAAGGEPEQHRSKAAEEHEKAD